MKFHNKYRILNQNQKQTVDTRRKIQRARPGTQSLFFGDTRKCRQERRIRYDLRRERWGTETSQTEHTQAATTQTRCILLMQEQLFRQSLCLQPMYTPIPTRSNNEERFKYANPWFAWISCESCPVELSRMSKEATKYGHARICNNPPQYNNP